MKIHEMILNILDERGTIPIPTLCQELSKPGVNNNNRQHFVHPATIKSVIERKNDLFLLKNDLVTIRPNKRVTLLTADVGDGLGSWYKINVDFINKTFTHFEWHLNRNRQVLGLQEGDGDIDKFKFALFRSGIWDWEQEYEEDGIALDGTSWSIKLITVGKTYESKGFRSFPTKWPTFCTAVQQLTGKPFN